MQAPRSGGAKGRKLLEANLDVGALFQVHGVNKSHLTILQSHHQGMRADAVAEEANAAQKISVGNSRTSKDDVLARRQVTGFIDAVRVLDAHFFEAFAVFGFRNDEAGEDFAVEAAQGRGGEDTFGRSAAAHDGVYAG